MVNLEPRLTSKEASLFREKLSQARHYLEFGGGGSTRLALESPVLRVTSVESDVKWIAKLREVPLVAENEKAGRLKLRHIDIGPTGDWGIPADESKIKFWHEYYTSVWVSGETNYDFVFIDGRFRVSCALMSALFCHENSIIVFHDYNNRHKYSVVEKFFNVVNSADSMVIFKIKDVINYKSLVVDLLQNQYSFF